MILKAEVEGEKSENLYFISFSADTDQELPDVFINGYRNADLDLISNVDVCEPDEKDLEWYFI